MNEIQKIPISRIRYASIKLFVKPKYWTIICELGFKSGLNVQSCQAKSGFGTDGESWQGIKVVKKDVIKTAIEMTVETITFLLRSIDFLGLGNL